MTTSLNTLVPGSAGSVRAGAEWLKGLTKAALDGSARATAARDTADAGWWGPASGRFHEAAYGVICAYDDLSASSSTAEQGLRDFADGLDKVNEKMQTARDTAVSGSLEVAADTFIMAPDKASLVTTAKPETPTSTDSADLQKYNEAAAQYNAQLAEYNARVKVFNECSTLVKEARILEDQTHAALEANLATVAPKGVTTPSGFHPGAAGPQPANPIPWSIGGTVVSKALDYGNEKQNQWQEGRLRAISQANKAVNDAVVFQQLATGRRFSDFHPTRAQRALLAEKAKQAGLARNSQLALVKAYEQNLPASWRTAEKWVALDDTDARRAMTTRVRADLEHPNKVKSIGRGVIIVGGVITVAGEIEKFNAGEQSLPGTVVKSVGLIGANLVGGAIGSNLGGPVGSVALGTLLEMKVDDVIEDQLVRDFDIPYNQAWLTEEQYARRY